MPMNDIDTIQGIVDNWFGQLAILKRNLNEWDDDLMKDNDSLWYYVI